MSQRLTAYNYCRGVVFRGTAMIHLYDKIMGSTSLTQPSSGSDLRRTDLIRTGVVLSVSAMDTYYTRRFVELLIPFVKRKGVTERLAALLVDAGLDTKQAVEMAMMKRPLRRLRSLLNRHLEKKVTQRFRVVDDLFLAYGIKDLTGHAEAATGRKKLRASVEILVQRRHRIVHDGDLDSRGRLRQIRSEEMLRRIEDMCKLVDASEEILNRIV